MDGEQWQPADSSEACRRSAEAELRISARGALELKELAFTAMTQHITEATPPPIAVVDTADGHADARVAGRRSRRRSPAMSRRAFAGE